MYFPDNQLHWSTHILGWTSKGVFYGVRGHWSWIWNSLLKIGSSFLRYSMSNMSKFAFLTCYISNTKANLKKNDTIFEISALENPQNHFNFVCLKICFDQCDLLRKIIFFQITSTLVKNWEKIVWQNLWECFLGFSRSPIMNMTLVFFSDWLLFLRYSMSKMSKLSFFPKTTLTLSA